MATMASLTARGTCIAPRFDAESTLHKQQRCMPLAYQLHKWFYILCICMLTVAGSEAATWAQTFQAVPALSFTKTVNSASNPLPQVLAVASTGASFQFSVAVANTSGGNWLSASANGCCLSTPGVVTLTANPDVSLAVGTYTATLTLTSRDGAQTKNVPVSLFVEPTSSAYFDELPGGLTFSRAADGKAPPSQPLSIRNAGSGALNWTASTSTSDGGKWITLSSSSGTAPSTPSISINPANLPSGGKVEGTFTGQVLLKAGSDTVSIPVSVSIYGDASNAAFDQVNGLDFTKMLNSTSNPLSQVITVDSNGISFQFSVAVVNGTGGAWLSSNVNGCCGSTPDAVTLTANPATNLAAGTYTSEVIITSRDGTKAMVVPVNLTVASPSASYFDELAGEITFSMAVSGKAPPSQALPIRNAGSGSLSWTASTTTADGGNWLSLTATSGTAPSTPNVSINPANLPDSGQVAGTFTGQVWLISGNDAVSIPVTVTVGDSVFEQINPLNFTKTLNSTSNPLSQVISVSSNDSSFQFSIAVVNGTGGAWLAASANGCCASTPDAITLTASPATNLGAGTYTAEVILTSRDGTQSMVVPVTLTVQAPSATYFDELPGQLTFSMAVAGKAPPTELVQVRNAGAGTLSFTAASTTADGGTWITLSATSGTAPYLLSVGINPANLPSNGQVAGTFTGQVLLKTGSDVTTIPVSVTVGNSVFAQLSPLSFTKTLNSTSNPLPQVITVASNGASFQFGISVVEGTGGSWLSTNVNGCCGSTSDTLVVTANPAQTLAAAIYTAEIIITSRDGTQSMVVPVSLTVEPTSATYLDELPGGLTFSAQAGTTAISSQPLMIRNAGARTLNWMASTSTADGGNWLSLSSTAGAAPSNPTVNINRANLPSQGKVAGTFVGQILLQSVGDIVTIPVTVTIGDSVFKQLSAVSFSKNYQATNPPTQTITASSTDASFQFSVAVVNGTGSNWLSASVNGCCASTPDTITLTANPASSLAPGVYVAEVTLISRDGTEPMVIPVSLTVNSSSATAAPAFNPPGGTYTGTQHVVITSATPDAAIYYTVNGSTPTTSSTVYTGPITVSVSETLKAIAIAPGYPLSAVGSATYNLGAAAATPAATSTITITEATSGATVYYTTNGSTPTSSSAKYSGPITLSASTVLKFIAIGPGYNPSQVKTVSTTIQ